MTQPAGGVHVPAPAALLLPTAGALLLLAAALAPAGVLALPVALLQAGLVLAWLALSGVSGSGGGAALAAVAALAADVGVLAGGADGARALGPVVGLALGAAFLHQLLRGRRRAGVTASLAAELTAVLLVVAAACWLAAREQPVGRGLVVTAAVGLGVAVLTGRGLARVVRARDVPPGGRRLAAAVTGAALGAAAGALAGQAYDGVGAGYGALVSAAAALAAVTADLAAGTAAAGVGSEASRAHGAVLPVAVLLPLVAAAPAAFVVGRLLLG